ncbi:MAG: hypothetical protein JXD23_02100 [Spirochaetales bacterium]|nr:hypothetical protein [Spirochaetales bacterium]
MNNSALAFVFAILGGFAAYGQPAVDAAFFDYCAQTVRTTVDPRTVRGLDDWFFFKPELAHLSKKAFWGNNSRTVSASKKAEWADPLPAVVDFNERLNKRGIELIFIPVPAKAAVYPDMLKGSPVTNAANRLDYFHAEFYKLLRSKGVNVVDIAPLLLAHRNDKRGPVYCATDTHWSGSACELAADALAKEIKKENWYTSVSKLSLSAERKSISISGDLVDKKSSPVKEKINLRRIVDKKTGSPVSPRDSSPVVLLGDSHTLVFHAGGDMYAEGAGLADQLAYELGFPVDLIGVRGSGSTASRVNLYRKSKADPNYLSGKKVVIWCLSVREFTESAEGWRSVPIGPGNE